MELSNETLTVLKNFSSINQGIQFVQQQRISVTKRSGNLIKEYRNYLWATDKQGKILNEPEGGLDHALDAVRYAFTSIAPKQHEKDRLKQFAITRMNLASNDNV